MPAEGTARREVARVCRRLWERGLIAGGDGNVSVRLAPDRILVTPAGVSKVDVRPADLVLIRADGRTVGGGRPSTELGMHLRIYARRPDVGAVVHAHPPAATAFAVGGETLPAALPEVVVALGPVALVPYATPGTPELADALEPFLDAHDVFLLANHGATAIGAGLGVAHQRMESLEHSARIVLASRLLGRVNTLPIGAIEALRCIGAGGDARTGRPTPLNAGRKGRRR